MMYKLATYEVDSLERFHRKWVGKSEISALRSALEKGKQAIDRLPGGNK